MIGLGYVGMPIAVAFAKTMGSILPMVTAKIGFDPAVMASPFITTIVDAISLLVFFGISSAVIPGLS